MVCHARISEETERDTERDRQVEGIKVTTTLQQEVERASTGRIVADREANSPSECSSERKLVWGESEMKI